MIDDLEKVLIYIWLGYFDINWNFVSYEKKTKKMEIKKPNFKSEQLLCGMWILKVGIKYPQIQNTEKSLLPIVVVFADAYFVVLYTNKYAAQLKALKIENYRPFLYREKKIPR